MKPIRVHDLQDQIGAPHPRPFLHCTVCGAEYSAHAGDYFAAGPDAIMTCCGEPMVLVRRETRLVGVQHA